MDAMKAINPLRIAVRGLLLCTLIGCGVATADAFSTPEVATDATPTVQTAAMVTAAG
jgi:hypothetical protein